VRELVALRATRVGAAHRQAVFRIDGGYGTQPQIKWLLATDRLFIAKAAVRKAAKWAARVRPADWRLVRGATGARVAEVSAGNGVRGIICEGSAPSGTTAYAVLLTNLAAEFDAVHLWRLSSERQTIEAFFKVGRNA
jgi:hypothetical protein